MAPLSVMEPIKLNIGSRTRAAGWKTFDIDAGPEVDFVGDCRDLSRFQDDSIAEIYASHVLEHLSYKEEIQPALKEWFRVLIPDGFVMISVPDLDILCRLFVHPKIDQQERARVMQMIFGGQENGYDFHKAGLWPELLGSMLHKAGFVHIERMPSFSLFDDYSTFTLRGMPINLNVKAHKPPK